MVPPDVYSLDLNTGLHTLESALHPSWETEGLAYDPQRDILYALNNKTTDWIGELDGTTGSVTLLPFLLPGGDWRGLTWDTANGGKLYASTVDDLYEYHVAVGPSYVASFGGQEVYGLAFAHNNPFNPELYLGSPFPGSAGSVNGVHVLNAGSLSSVYVGFSAALGSYPVPGCPDALSLAAPFSFGSATADAYGNALVTHHIPASQVGSSVYFQAFDKSLCSVSNVVEHLFL